MRQRFLHSLLLLFFMDTAILPTTFRTRQKENEESASLKSQIHDSVIIRGKTGTREEKGRKNLVESGKSCTFAAAFDEAPVDDEGGKDF